MKMVESKYKNPDKFIEQLKGTIDTKHGRIQRLLLQISELRGDVVVYWNRSVTRRQGLTSRDLGDFMLGDRLIHVGEVTSVKEFHNSAGYPESEIEYRLLRTRKTRDERL